MNQQINAHTLIFYSQAYRFYFILDKLHIPWLYSVLTKYFGFTKKTTYFPVAWREFFTVL